MAEVYLVVADFLFYSYQISLSLKGPILHFSPTPPSSRVPKTFRLTENRQSSSQNKRKYGTERATEGERITIASNLGLFVVLACLLN